MPPMTYAVVWRENEGESYAGELSLDHDAVVLSGTASGVRESQRRLRFDDLADARVERRDGPLLVLLGPTGSRVEVASLEGAGALHELAEQIAVGLGKPAG
jgi:hypothetical protein